MKQLYQAWDEGLFDYEMYSHGGLELRGPEPRGGPAIAFIGAAQTFGRYCREPYPALLAAALDLAALNFGVGGMGPEFFLRRPTILEAANRSEMVILQVLSARSVSNSVFRATVGGRDGVRLIDGKPMAAEDLYHDLVTRADPRGGDAMFIADLVEQTRRSYAAQMIRLLQAIQRPTILFWFSVRSPDRTESRLGLDAHSIVALVKRGCRAAGLISPRDALLGAYPHLVDANTLATIRAHADAYAECVTSAGLPQIVLQARRRVARWNNYYPSPAMHRAAAASLLPVCRSMLAR